MRGYWQSGDVGKGGGSYGGPIYLPDQGGTKGQNLIEIPYNFNFIFTQESTDQVMAGGKNYWALGYMHYEFVMSGKPSDFIYTNGSLITNSQGLVTPFRFVMDWFVLGIWDGNDESSLGEVSSLSKWKVTIQKLIQQYTNYKIPRFTESPIEEPGYAIMKQNRKYVGFGTSSKQSGSGTNYIGYPNYLTTHLKNNSIPGFSTTYNRAFDILVPTYSYPPSPIAKPDYTLQMTGQLPGYLRYSDRLSATTNTPISSPIYLRPWYGGTYVSFSLLDELFTCDDFSYPGAPYFYTPMVTGEQGINNTTNFMIPNYCMVFYAYPI